MWTLHLLYTSKTNKTLNKYLKEKIGFLLFAGALITYILIKLPSDTSVLCSNGNEGFYFVYGHHLLNGKHLYTDILTARGPLFIVFYSLILAMFGFATYSIIAVHLFHTLIIILISIAIYLITKKITSNSLYGGLAVFFWVLFQITPIGLWGHKFELEATFALEAEYFCVLFSLYSVLCALFALELKLGNKKSLILSFCSGLLAAVSIMFKASGAVLAIAMICWMIYLFVFEKELLNTWKNSIIFCLFGLFISLLLFGFSLFLYNGELASFWQSYFMLGNYSSEPLSFWLLILRIKRFMFRYTSSLSNFILFFITFLFLFWGLVRKCVVKNSNKTLSLLFPLISIWGVGSVCAIIAAGDYGSYYYILIWPAASIVLSLGLYDLFNNKTMNKNIIKYTLTFLILLFAFNRLQAVFPGYRTVIKAKLDANILRQPQSFQDPVLQYDLPSVKRGAVLSIGDIVNSHLPNKNDSLYIFAFAQGHQYFGPPIYMYAKRPPVTPIISDWLYYEKSIKVSLAILRKQLFNNLPTILIIPGNPHLQKWQIKPLLPFFDELNQVIKENYHLKDTFNIEMEKDLDVYQVFERNQTNF